MASDPYILVGSLFVPPLGESEPNRASEIQDLYLERTIVFGASVRRSIGRCSGGRLLAMT